MPFSAVIFAYFLLIIAFSILAYYGVTFLLKKWDEAQQHKAEQTASQLEEMFVFVRQKALIYLYVIIPLLFAFLAYFFTKKTWVVLVSAIIGIILPLWFVRIMEKRRRKTFIVQLVDGLMILNSCLKGGLTLVQSFEILSDEMTPPLSQEVSLLNREIKMGVPLEEALIRIDRRMPSEEMTLVTSAILVARETGGDLTKVFSRLVETIRDRIKLKEMVATLTLQARLQSIIISLLGPIFFLIVRKIRPDHFDIMWQHNLGRILIAIAIVLQVTGFVLIIIFGRVEI